MYYIKFFTVLAFFVISHTCCFAGYSGCFSGVFKFKGQKKPVAFEMYVYQFNSEMHVRLIIHKSSKLKSKIIGDACYYGIMSHYNYDFVKSISTNNFKSEGNYPKELHIFMISNSKMKLKSCLRCELSNDFFLYNNSYSQLEKFKEKVQTKRFEIYYEDNKSRFIGSYGIKSYYQGKEELIEIKNGDRNSPIKFYIRHTRDWDIFDMQALVIPKRPLRIGSLENAVFYKILDYGRYNHSRNEYLDNMKIEVYVANSLKDAYEVFRYDEPHLLIDDEIPYATIYGKAISNQNEQAISKYEESLRIKLKPKNDYTILGYIAMAFIFEKWRKDSNENDELLTQSLATLGRNKSVSNFFKALDRSYTEEEIGYLTRLSCLILSNNFKPQTITREVLIEAVKQELLREYPNQEFEIETINLLVSLYLQKQSIKRK